MKTKIIPSLLLMTGFLIGASALSALAQSISAPSNPPDCPLTIPGCNPPINEGEDEQTKKGSLIINKGWEDESGTWAFPVGLTVFGDSVFEGGVLASGDVCTDVSEDRICMSELVPVPDVPVTACTASSGNFGVLSTSGTSGERISGNGWYRMALPAQCKNGGTCRLRQEIYNVSVSPKVMTIYRDYTFSQGVTPSDTTVDVLWNSDYAETGNRKNGNTSSNAMVPEYSDHRIVVRDDYSGTVYSDVSNSDITLRDYSTKYDQVVYFCPN